MQISGQEAAEKSQNFGQREEEKEGFEWAKSGCDMRGQWKFHGSAAAPAAKFTFLARKGKRRKAEEEGGGGR